MYYNFNVRDGIIMNYQDGKIGKLKLQYSLSNDGKKERLIC